MRVKDACAVLDVEIEWCKQHRAEMLSDEYREGFIGGLEQAKLLIGSMMKAIHSDKDVREYRTLVGSAR